MNYKIVWSKFAQYQLDLIFNFYAREVSVQVAQFIIYQIRDQVVVLINNPFIGEKEVLLNDRKEIYRRLVVSNYKIIYSVDEKTQIVKVADIFDTRQNPVKIKRN